MKNLVLTIAFAISFSLLQAQTFTVTNTAASGTGSLAAAITAANAYVGVPPTIIFNIESLPTDSSVNGWKWWSIRMSYSADLPTLTKAGTRILGFTQSLHKGIVDHDSIGSGGFVGVDKISLPKFERPTICIKGSNRAAVFTINANDVTIEGISFYHASQYAVRTINAVSNIYLTKLIVGVLPSGAKPVDSLRNNRMGIQHEGTGSVFVSNCLSAHNGRVGINGANSYSIYHLSYCETYENNWYSTNDHDGIDINGHKSTVKYCLSYNNKSGFNPNDRSIGGGAGIELGSTSPGRPTRNLVENNTCYGNNGPGISVINGCLNNVIRRNICYGNELGIGVSARTGVTTYDSVTTLIQENLVYHNKSVGIDIQHDKTFGYYDRVTQNNAVNVGNGPFGNNRQHYPIITNAYLQRDTLFFSGTLSSAPSKLHRVELFGNSAKDSIYGVESEFGEGQFFIGYVDLITDSLGEGVFNSFSVLPTKDSTTYLTSTGSNLVDSVTSEFGPVFTIDKKGKGLPVNLISFVVNLKGNDIALNWKTTAEEKFSHFIVEKSLTGLEFNSSQNVNANGNFSGVNSYSVADKLTEDKQYYRLKLVDNDGTFKYSNIVVASKTTKTYNVVQSVYPNPANNQVTFQLSKDIKGNSNLQIVNQLGQVVFTSAIRNDVKEFNLDLNTLKEGVYFYKLTNNSESSSGVLQIKR